MTFHQRVTDGTRTRIILLHREESYSKLDHSYHVMRRTGLEPATACLKGKCSGPIAEPPTAELPTRKMPPARFELALDRV